MTYTRRFPDVSRPKASHAALTFADWSETEAAQRIGKLLAAGWSTAQVARMLAIRPQEIERLVARYPSTIQGVSV